MKTTANPLNSLGAASDTATLDFSPKTRFRRRAGVVLCHVAEKHMLVPAMTNAVDLDCLFLLNDTGVFIWEQLDGQRQMVELGRALAGVFAVDAETATDDVAGFLANLFEENLVEIAGELGGPFGPVHYDGRPLRS